MTIGEIWASVYFTFPDNAFDYVGKPLYVEEGIVKIWDGSRMVQYAEPPF